MRNSIDDYAQSLAGYRGVDRWVSPDGAKNSSTFYFDDMTSVSVFSTFPDHLEAKHKYQQWYQGCQIVISEVTASYGDGTLGHISQGDE
jgi:hypothetical protein